MAAPQGIVTFAGIQALPFLGCTFTLQHGIAPNVCQIQIAPQMGKLIEGGTLSFIYGGTRIDFPHCKVDFIESTVTAQGLQVWTLYLLDRRWKWQFGGQVSGYYNVRTGDGNNIRPGTRKKPRELAEICLKAMGEDDFKLNKMPNDVFPEIEWDYTLPAEALAKLCDAVGCHVVLKQNNQVVVEPVGEGQKIDKAGALEYSESVNPPERPDSLIFVGDRTLYQADLELEPVGRETDHTWKHINDLSYAPGPVVQGCKWAGFDPGFAMIVDKKVRELAKQDIFRKYRIKVPFDMPITGRRIANLDFILPVLREQLKTVITGRVDGHNVTKRKPAIVWGRFAMGNESVTNNTPDPFLDPEGDPRWIIQRGWSLDVETGIVSFDEPVFKYVFKTVLVDGKPIQVADAKLPADIKLRCALGTRDEVTLAWGHYEVERKSRQKKFGTKPRYIKRSDVQRIIFIDIDGLLVDTRQQFEEQAKHYLDEAEKQYEISEPQSATYVGLRKIDLDGAIQQVTWTISESGSTTRVSRNKEELVVTQSHAERRLFQRINDALKAEGDAARVRDERLARRPA